MKIKNEDDLELEVLKNRNKLGIIIYEIDRYGCCKQGFGMEINKQQAIKLANYINSQFK